MRLAKAHVTLFKSIDDSGEVIIESDVTALVGQNGSGKTAFLQALYKAFPIENIGYEYIKDYPRKILTFYEEEHKNKPATVVKLTYVLNENEVQAINENLDYLLLNKLSFTISCDYENHRTIGLEIPNEGNYLNHLINNSPLPKETKNEISNATTFEDMFEILNNTDLNSESTEFFDELKQKFNKPSQNSTWKIFNYYIWNNHLSPWLAKFIYFDEYQFLPGKVNLPTLQQKK